jgi:ABC-2 type transport system permease protein
VVMADTLTPLEKNTVLIGLDGSILANRLLWTCLASAILVFTYNRFRPGHREG